MKLRCKWPSFKIWMIAVFKDMGYNYCAVIVDDETPAKPYHFGGTAFSDRY